MAMRRLLPLAMFGMVVSLTACAGTGRSTPPVAQQVHPTWLVGTWQGTAWQVTTSQTQGEVNVTVTFAKGGTWKAMSGASGTSWLVGDWVVLDGVAADGGRIRYTLKERRDAGGDHELWGIAEAAFGAAAVSLKRVR
jgi:hypothetical protein